MAPGTQAKSTVVKRRAAAVDGDRVNMRHKVSDKLALFIIRNFDPIARLVRRRHAVIHVCQTVDEKRRLDGILIVVAIVRILREHWLPVSARHVRHVACDAVVVHRGVLGREVPA